MESRTYHAASIISILVLSGFFVVNFVLGLWSVFALSLTVLVLQSASYCLSRFKQRFKLAVVCSAMLSYIALIINYSLNSGINGPTIFMFFFTFNLLIIVTPRSQHYIWVILHVLVVFVLVMAELYFPEWYKNSYPDPLWRTLDIFFTYLITLIFIYYVSIYLRNYYYFEKKLAHKRLINLMNQMRTVKKQEHDIQKKNEALLRIAFIQSHELRGPLSSIMGLMAILRESGHDNNDEYLALMDKAVKELDLRIHLIMEQTEELKHQTEED